MNKKKGPKPKRFVFVKNPQFYSDPADILATKPTHVIIIFTKFHKDRRKIVDFLVIAMIWAWELFFNHPLYLKGFF